jgi:hypothetical protein
MAKSVDELLVLVAEGDEEAAGELRTLLGSKDREAALARRDLKLKTDVTLKERYPRALRAFDKGRLKFTDNMSEAEMLDALRDKEEELAELGVAVDPPTSASGAPVEPVAVETDPAKALSGGKAASSPGGSPRDLVAEYFDAMKGSTEHDRAKANNILVELNQAKQQDKIDQITRSLEARPIILKGI